MSNARLKLVKNEAKPKEHPDAELFLFENHSLSSPMLSSKNNTVCNFQYMKSSVELNNLFSKFFCYITWFVISPD